MWPLNVNQIKQIHFDLTNYCNAKCPECTREIDDFAKPHLDNSFIDLNILKEKVNKNTLPNIEFLRFCGSFGDPLTHPNFLDMSKFLFEQYPNARSVVSTNGGLRSKKYFKDLAKIYNGNKSIVFGIDGLSDTNHKYRVNVNWDKLYENFSTFISAGGSATWQFIAFPWNEHQIEEAKEKSKEWGFTDFWLIGSHRNSEYNEKYGDKDLKDKDILPQKVYQSKIQCVVVHDQDIMIMHDGTVYPCCYIGSRLYALDERLDHWYNVIGGKDKLSLYKYSIEEIINGKFFDIVAKSWDIDENDPMGKCHICVNACQTMVERDKFTGFVN